MNFTNGIHMINDPRITQISK